MGEVIALSLLMGACLGWATLKLWHIWHNRPIVVRGDDGRWRAVPRR